MKQYRNDLYGNPYEEPPGFVRKWVRDRVRKGDTESDLNPSRAVTPLWKASLATLVILFGYYAYTENRVYPAMVAVIFMLEINVIFAGYVNFRKGAFNKIVAEELQLHREETAGDLTQIESSPEED